MYTPIQAHRSCQTSSKHSYSQKALQTVAIQHAIPLVTVKWKDTMAWYGNQFYLHSSLTTDQLQSGRDSCLMRCIQ